MGTAVFSCVPNIRLRRRDDLVQSSEIMAHYDRSRSSNGTNRQPVCDFLSAVDSIVGYRPIFHSFRDAATKTPEISQFLPAPAVSFERPLGLISR